MTYILYYFKDVLSYDKMYDVLGVLNARGACGTNNTRDSFDPTCMRNGF
jgi:hypothetical protein